MIARIFRLSTALCVSLATWLQQPVATISCGDYQPERDHITCFDPTVLPDSLFGTYFRLAIGGASAMGSEEEFHWPEDTASPFDPNIHDWSEYLGGRVALADIDAFVYGDSLQLLEGLMQTMRQGEAGPQWPGRGRATVQDIVRRGDTAMLRYLIFAKSVEPYALAGFDERGWHYGSETPNRSEIPRLIQRGRAEAGACRDERLRLRYGYQLVRLAYYASLFERAIGLYDTLVAPNSARLHVRYLAMLNRSGALARAGRRAEALHLLSTVFERYPDRRWASLHDFVVPNDTTWDSACSMARTDHERSVMWMMRGLREYRLDTRPMEMMVKLEPGDPRLDVMLVREVREVERKLFSERVTRPLNQQLEKTGSGTAVVYLHGDSQAENWTDSADDKGYPMRLARFAERTAERRLVPNRALWYAVAGYMRIIADDFPAAGRDLDRAARYLKEGGRLEEQIRALRLLAASRSDRWLSTDIASRFISAVAWFDSSRRSDLNPIPYVPAATLLGQKFLRQGDIPRAAAAFIRGGRRHAANALLDCYATDRELLRLQRLLERPQHRPVDTILFDRFPLGARQILDLRATRMMRRGSFAGAVRLWDQLDNLRDAATGSDSLARALSQINDIFTAVIDTTLPGETSPGYKPAEREITRPEFSRQMLAFERLAGRSRANRVRYGYAIARALRSTPYWGYGLVWSGYLVNGFRYYARPVDFPFNDPAISRRMTKAQVNFLREFGSNEMAWRYLDRARRATTNPELAAQIAFEMDQALKDPLTALHTNPEHQNRTGYNLLRTRYRETTFAKRILSNCLTYEYFRTRPSP